MPRSARLARLAAAAALGLALCACSTGPVAAVRVSQSASSTASTSTPATTTPATTTPPSPTAPPATTARATPSSATATAARTSAARTTPRVPAAADALPLGYATGSATQVITVTAPSASSIQATVQAWTRSAGGWTRVGPAVPAFLGSDGMSTHASESWSATPIGSFTLTQAFGHDANPGTGLPYFQTDDADWWISQAGPLYNTHQRCAGSCPFAQGAPNEHLARELPFYDYAVVIDYNTTDAPGGVRPGAGSAIFLHVHPPGSGPTAGCVAVPEDQMIRLLRWLTPAAHPRILIGTA
jgi:L,D-peptidoglycan transpeptidase YkuD (ErfK/YbiS/YcfS/YnhG family)